MKSLNVLYTTKNTDAGLEHFIIDIFTKKEMLLEGGPLQTGAQASFSSLEKLGFFCLELCKEFGLHDCFLLSSEEYNKALVSSIESREDFETLFESFGTRIQLKEEDRKGFLSRIFN